MEHHNGFSSVFEQVSLLNTACIILLEENQNVHVCMISES